MSTERQGLVGTILPPIAEVPPWQAGHGGTRGHEGQGESSPEFDVARLFPREPDS